MLYKDYGFRTLYHNFCFFPLPEELKEQVQHYPGHAADTVTHVLTYGYIDQRKGLTLAVLCLGYIHGEDELSFYRRMDKDWVTVSIQELKDQPFMYLENSEGNLAKQHAGALKHFSAYDAKESLEKIRAMRFLDVHRHPIHPDMVKVFLLREGRELEPCWVAAFDTGDHCIVGILSSEPNQDFDWHAGDTVAFHIKELEDNRTICYADMNPAHKRTREELADGSVLKAAISAFGAEQNQQNFFDVLELLRDSYVWIPCHTILSEEEQAHMEELIRQAEENGGLDSLIGHTFQSVGEVRLQPDILSRGDKFFFPVFTSVEDMGEYGEGFSKLEKHFLDAIEMAMANEKELAGIVVNAFSEFFVLESSIFDLVQKLKTSIVE